MASPTITCTCQEREARGSEGGAAKDRRDRGGWISRIERAFRGKSGKKAISRYVTRNGRNLARDVTGNS